MMRKPFFDSDARREALFATVARWEDTPFVDHGRIRGAGVDCVNFAGLVLVEVGHLPSFNPPAYTLDGGMNLKESTVTKWIEASGRFDPVEGTVFETGDVLCFASCRESKIAHHVGIYLGTPGHNFVNAMPRYGVKIRTMHDPVWAAFLRRVYRPMREVAS
jgi:cell wall-associated NlpC family hydrolase